MKAQRTILAGLYLLIMVLLPFLHLPSHADEGSGGVADVSVCGHGHAHHHDSDSKPDHSENEHDACSLCDLLTLPAQVESVSIVTSSAFSVSNIFEVPRAIWKSTYMQASQARAPPLQTV